MVGELAPTTQWCSDHRMKVRLAYLVQPTEEVTGKPTSHKRAGHHYRVLSTHGPTVFTFFFNELELKVLFYLLSSSFK